MTTTPDTRDTIADVLERHTSHLVNQPDDEDRCVICDVIVPCDAVRLALALRDTVDTPIMFDLRDLVVILDCLDADARSPWLIGAHELAPDRHRIAETIRSIINDDDVSEVAAIYRDNRKETG